MGDVQVCMDACFLKASHAGLLSEGRSLRRNVRYIRIL